MRFPNKYLRNIKPYKLASHRIWAVDEDERKEILKLDWNEATLPPSPRVKESIQRLLDGADFFNLYPTTHNERLLQLLAQYAGVDIQNIQYFASSDALHEYICKVYIGVGDPVMILGPSYDNFRLTCQANGAEVFYSNYNDDFSFDPVQFEQDIRQKEPAVVYICNPNNPTGNVHTEQYIRHLLEEFTDTLFLIDEAYYEFSGLTVKDLVKEFDNILISRTMSKAFALANFRVGYLIASKDNVQFVNRIRNPKNVSTIAQTAAIAALEDTDYMWKYVHDVHEGQEYFLQATASLCDEMIVHPGHGNFLLVEFPSYEKKMALLHYLAEHNIFVRDTMQNRSVERCFRITCGTKAQMQHVTEVLQAYYAK